jgi:uncharacterized protein with von Willebrand factor type A (vWA) domain
MVNEFSSQSGGLTRRDVAVARGLRAAPLAAWAVATIPVPLIFTILYFLATQDAAIYLLTAFASLGIGFVLGSIVALVVYLYRKRWERSLRERLAANGITAEEIPYFNDELTSSERNSLRRLQRENPLLGDAYSETLAARLTATRLLKKAKKELLQVDNRLARVQELRNADTSALQADLAEDRRRLETVKVSAEEHLARAKAQLQSIEAVASRADLWPKTDLAIERLNSAAQQPPLALEAAKLELAAREQVNEMMKASHEGADTIPGHPESS